MLCEKICPRGHWRTALLSKLTNPPSTTETPGTTVAFVPVLTAANIVMALPPNSIAPPELECIAEPRLPLRMVFALMMVSPSIRIRAEPGSNAIAPAESSAKLLLILQLLRVTFMFAIARAPPEESVLAMDDALFRVRLHDSIAS